MMIAAFLQAAIGTAQRYACLSLGLWLCLAAPTAAAAQGDAVEEYRLKSAFIYNFSQFIEWPAMAFAKADSPFAICVMGHDPFGEALHALEKRSYNTHPIVINYPKSVVEARTCKILYVDDLANAELGRNPHLALGDLPILTISSDEGAMDAGIGIGFVDQGGKLRWNLNLDVVRKAQLKVSAKLIEIAVMVVGERKR